MEVNSSSLLPCIAVGLSCQEKQSKTFLEQRGESETACAQSMELPTQPGFANMHYMCGQYSRELPEQGTWTLVRKLYLQWVGHAKSQKSRNCQGPM